MQDNYRRLEKDEVIEEGDLVDVCNNGWHDEPKWVETNCVGKLAPDPSYPSHRQYKRLINKNDT